MATNGRLTKREKAVIPGQMHLPISRGQIVGDGIVGKIEGIRQGKPALRTVNSKGRVCLPQDLRDILNIADGDSVVVTHVELNGVDYAMIRKLGICSGEALQCQM